MIMSAKFDNGIRFKKIEGSKPRPKDTSPKPVETPEPVKIEAKKEPIKPPEPPKPEVKQDSKPPEILKPIKPTELPTPEPIKLEPETPKGPPKIEIHIPEKVKTGAFIFVPDMPDKVASVCLNNSGLNARTDYIIQGKNICFSFNVRKNEKITIIEQVGV